MRRMGACRASPWLPCCALPWQGPGPRPAPAPHYNYVAVQQARTPLSSLPCSVLFLLYVHAMRRAIHAQMQSQEVTETAAASAWAAHASGLPPGAPGRPPPPGRAGPPPPLQAAAGADELYGSAGNVRLGPQPTRLGLQRSASASNRVAPAAPPLPGRLAAGTPPPGLASGPNLAAVPRRAGAAPPVRVASGDSSSRQQPSSPQQPARAPAASGGAEATTWHQHQKHQQNQQLARPPPARPAGGPASTSWPARVHQDQDPRQGPAMARSGGIALKAGIPPAPGVGVPGVGNPPSGAAPLLPDAPSIARPC